MRIQSSPIRLATWKAISSRISGAREEKLNEEDDEEEGSVSDSFELSLVANGKMDARSFG